MKQPNPRIECVDGTTLSVQASQYCYCEPRDDDGPYVRKEVGFICGADGAPLTPPSSWADFADGEFPSDVYGYVPVEMIEEFIVEHGGRK